MRYVTKTPEHGNQGRAFFVCPSRWEKQARQRCTYFQFEDEENEDVTSNNCDMSFIQTQLDDQEQRINALEKKWQSVEKLLKLDVVIIFVFIVKFYL